MLHALAVAITNRWQRRSTLDDRRDNPRIARVLANPKTIVVTRLQCLGDMVVFLPTLAALRRQYPKAHIIVVTKHAQGDELVCDAPMIDEVVNLGRASWREKRAVFRQLRRRGVDLFMISAQDLGRVPWAIACAAKVIVGFRTAVTRSRVGREKLPWLLSLPVEYDPDRTELENNLKIVAALGGDASPRRVSIDWCTIEERAQADRLLATEGCRDGDRLVLLSPGAKLETTRWEMPRWIEVARRLSQSSPNVRIAFSGGPGEHTAIQSTIDAENAPWINLAGRLSLLQFAYVVGRADLVVTVSSGPMHVADAMNTPMVALSGPTDLRKWRPVVSDASGRVVIAKHKACSPCAHVRCPLAVKECTAEITVEEVVAAAERLLAITSGRRNAASKLAG